MATKKTTYIFLHDRDGMYHRASQKTNGSYVITKNTAPYPIKYNPPNLSTAEAELATNNRYNSLIRNVTYPLDFIKDGAAILKEAYYLEKGMQSEILITIVEWNGLLGIHELSYSGKIDFSQKDDDPKTGKFTVSTTDDSAWGLLSQNDDVDYSIDCSHRNPKSVRVLVDGVTLLNKYTYQTVQSFIAPSAPSNFRMTVPFVLINQDGDSSGILSKSQIITPYDAGQGFVSGLVMYIPPKGSGFLYTAFAITGVTFVGEVMFIVNSSTGQLPGIQLYFVTNFGQGNKIFNKPGPDHVVLGNTYKIPFNFSLNLSAGEEVFLVAEIVGNLANNYTMNFIVTNTIISTKTKVEPAIVYGLRAIDLAKELVNKATRGRFTINSNHLTTNNKDVYTSGDAIRGIDNSKIYYSFRNLFQDMDCIYFSAMRQIKGELWLERAIEVYNNNPNHTIIDIGDIIDLQLEPAKEYFCNELDAGAPKQDFRHPSGRLEFNSTNTWSIPMFDIKKKLDLVTKARLGCMDIQFLILDYRGGSTQDNRGDKSTYLMKITDDLASAIDNVETFENITINNSPLAPIIKSPFASDIINFDKPTVKGIAPPGSSIKIYVDNSLDGNTTADGSGKWSYDIQSSLSSFDPGVSSGAHDISATFTDLTAPFDTVAIIVDTTVACPVEILYPAMNDILYNNKPLIKGVAPAGTNIDIILDNQPFGSVVTDNSCKWEFKAPVISNGIHQISIVGSGNIITFTVDSNVAFPLITYIGSELDSFPIVNNLPLIEGVALPGTTVQIWLNYIQYLELGSAVADTNGNWSFQVIQKTYIDPLANVPVILAPIKNGLNIISTLLVNKTVGINTIGYKLSRPNYSSITGVVDNSVFNTEYSPARIVEANYPRLAGMMNQQRQDIIQFETADKNGELTTVLGNKTVKENADIAASSLGNPIAIYEYAKIKTKSFKTFAQVLDDFNNGGVVKGNYRGIDLFFMPIGSMKIGSVRDSVKQWRLLISPQTSYQTLLNLYKTGLNINLMKNSLFHSDYNSLHCVEYNFQQLQKYNFKTIYQDWFNNRNDAWNQNPLYIQKYQKSDIIRDQIITNGLADMTFRLYRCSDAFLVDTIIYTAVNPAPIPPPDVVFEAIIDWSLYPEDQYFGILFVVDIPVAIFERIETREKWLGTILTESSSSINLTGAFFSTGFKTIIRTEGHIKKIQPNVESITAKENDGESELLFGQVSRKRLIRFGTARGLPDYLYMRMANALTLNNLTIEGVDYVLDDGEKIQPSEDVDGHPLYYYNVNLLLKDNANGVVFNGISGGSSADREGVILVVDGLALGLPRGSLINISLD